MMPSYAVAVLIVTPKGIPLIRDPKKPPPVFWKAPGGRSKAGEEPEAAAIREVQEETGLILAESDLSLVREEDRGSHILTLFYATTQSLDGLKERGEEGEEIRFFSAKEILGLAEFFPNHRKAFEKVLFNL